MPILVILDGLGDLPSPDNDYRTPLEMANVPNMDAICSNGWCGLMDSFEAGFACGSDTAHLSMFGYNPSIFYKGRGAFECIGAGLPLKTGEVAFKCVFAHKTLTGIILKRKIPNFAHEASLLCSEISKLPAKAFLPSYPNHFFTMKWTLDHRCVIKLSGPDLCSDISGNDPIFDNLPFLNCRPTEVDSKNAILTSNIVNELSHSINRFLSNHRINNDRSLEANVILFRAPAMAENFPTFAIQNQLSALMVAPTCIINGLGQSLSIEMADSSMLKRGGKIDSDLVKKSNILIDDINRRSDVIDLGIIHVKCTDDCGHSGDFYGKVRALEEADRMIANIIERMPSRSIIITGDHSTPCNLKDHSSEPVPFCIGSPILSGYNPNPFTESTCAQGILGRFKGSSLLNIIKTFNKKSQLQDEQN